MNRQLNMFYTMLALFPLEPKKMMKRARSVISYYRDLSEIKRQGVKSAVFFPFGQAYPCLDDRYRQGGTAKGHYFHQDLLVAKRILANAPRLHVDIGSRIDGFVAHVAVFREIQVFDVRPMPEPVANMQFQRVDFSAPIEEQFVDYCDSISCLHAVEHFGLGRYGDPIKFEAHLDGLDNIWRMLKRHGTCYFSVPIGPQRIEFNAHRVFSLGYLMELFQDRFRIDFFSYVDDQGNLHENVPLADGEVKNNFGCAYGCGIFEMTKL